MKTPNDDSSVISSLDFTFNPICEWDKAGRCVLGAAGVVTCLNCHDGEYRCRGHWAQMERASSGKLLTCDKCNERRPFEQMVRFVPLVKGS